LRINVGKDDPAGLIASEALRSDITSIERAISNSERANQVIATADSSLGQVSKLLNDIRGLVVEAANTGAMSEDQLSANQLQVDSSLEAINRIAQTTTFQGRRLLDGSLEFISTVGSVSTVVDAQIDQANLGTVGSVSVDVDISAAAAQAEITTTGFSAAQQATATINFSAGANIDSAANSFTIDIDAATLGDTEVGVAVSLVDSDPAVGVTVAYTAGTSLVITADFTNDGITGDDIIAAINAQQTAFVATGGAGTTSGQFTAADVVAFNAASVTTDRDSIDLQADTAGADFNQVAISVEAGAANGATFDATQNTLTVTVATGAQTVAALTTAINTDLAGVFTATGNADGSTRVDAATVDGDATANTDNTGGNVLLDDLVVSIGGETGREVFNFEAGASVNQIVAAVNLVSDATGVAATQNSGALDLNSTAYGSDAFVDIDVLDEGVAGTFESSLTAARTEGDNIQATVNGVNADGDGNVLRINTATLDLKLTVSDGDDTNFTFEITGGGALFQLGPDVVSNQQARLGIQSVNAAKLGGPSGRLYELASGGAKSLLTDPNGAFSVVDEVIDKVTTLRGRLGAFQRTTLDTNIASLTDTLTNLTEAESAIRDADFAKESSALTRAQILVQSGTSVLAIANSNPQSVLSLLR
jgi:flagellin